MDNMGLKVGVKRFWGREFRHVLNCVTGSFQGPVKEETL